LRSHGKNERFLFILAARAAAASWHANVRRLVVAAHVAAASWHAIRANKISMQHSLNRGIIITSAAAEDGESNRCVAHKTARPRIAPPPNLL